MVLSQADVEVRPARSKVGGVAMETPPTWPRAWTGLHQKVKCFWMDEGIDDVQDLAGFYTMEGEINDHLLSAG
eukprot:4007199-Heterocapsa_arctica.AAC.1